MYVIASNFGIARKTLQRTYKKQNQECLQPEQNLVIGGVCAQASGAANRAWVIELINLAV